MSDISDDELGAGRGEVDSTASPDWLILSGCSARALQLYMLLRLRLNRRRRTRKVWPGLATLAVMMKLKTSESVSPYIKELEKLGAIDVKRIGQTKHNVYLINFTPPPGYKGSLCIEDWDDDPRHKIAAQAIRDAEKAKRDKTRSKVAAKPQVRREPGKNQDQAGQAKTASADPGKNPDQDPGKNPDHDPGFFGVEPLGVTEVVDLTVRSSSFPSSSELVAVAPETGQTRDREENGDLPAEPESQETNQVETYESIKAKEFFPDLTDWERALLADVLAVPGTLWTSSPATKALGSRTVREVTQRDPELVRRAFLLGAADRNTVPLRMWFVDRCPHWKVAADALVAERAPAKEQIAVEAAAPRPEPTPRRAVPSQAARMSVPPVTSAPVAAKDSQAYLEWKRQNEERRAARRAVEEAEAARRRGISSVPVAEATVS